MLDAIENPRNARSRRTRAALLDAARSLLEEQGTEALTMAAVAERAGVSRRAVYLHFASRTQPLTELFADVSEQEGLAASLQPGWTPRCRRRPARVGRPPGPASTRASLPSPWPSSGSAAATPTPPGTGGWSWPTSRPAAAGWPGGLARERRLARPWTVPAATDMLWALMSFELLEELLVDRGWSPARYRAHLAALLAATFLAH